MSNKKIKEGLPSLKDGLPRAAFAIMGRSDRPATWKLPHHTRSMSLHWDRMPAAVAALSPGGYLGQCPDVSGEGEIIESARHLPNYYLRAGRPLPDTLAILI